MILSEEINMNEFQFNKNALLQVQRTQSFVIYNDNINSHKYEINNDISYKSKIIPFQMESLKLFNNDDKNYFNDINNAIFENISNLKRI